MHEVPTDSPVDAGIKLCGLARKQICEGRQIEDGCGRPKSRNCVRGFGPVDEPIRVKTNLRPRTDNRTQVNDWGLSGVSVSRAGPALDALPSSLQSLIVDPVGNG